MERHIKRIHGGRGFPVKDRSTKTRQSLAGNLPVDDRQATKHIHREDDFFDLMYEDFTWIKSRHEKATEMRIYFKDPMSSFGATISKEIPRQSPVSDPNLNGMFGSLSPVGESDPPVGFRTYVCENCLTGPVDPVRLSDFERVGPSAFNPSHVCGKEDLANRKRRIEKGHSVDVITVWSQLRLLSIQCIANVVHQWYGHKPYLYAIDETFVKPWIDNSLTVHNLETIQENHWACRALSEKNKKTSISSSELIQFLNLTFATFAPFKADIRGEPHYFYLCIPPVANQALLVQ